MKEINRFIVVDDDPTNNLICSYMLQRYYTGVKVHVFEKPELALESIKTMYSELDTNVTTVLFLDVNMPVLSGWEFLEIFAEFGSHVHNQISIYMLSSSVDHRDRMQADSNPFVSGYVSKPLAADWIKNNLFEQPVI